MSSSNDPAKFSYDTGPTGLWLAGVLDKSGAWPSRAAHGPCTTGRTRAW